MPEPTARNIAFTGLIVATIAAVLAAVFFLLAKTIMLRYR
jgi:hypothetical protein